jgi:HEPN domain-containing protein
MARGKLRDAQALLKTGRYDTAYYICGYAVELALKARICRSLKWEDYPRTAGEFSALQSFKTHSLVVLLHLSGIEARVRTNYAAQWSIVSVWNPEDRYNLVGLVSQTAAAEMVGAARELLGVILP